VAGALAAPRVSAPDMIAAVVRLAAALERAGIDYALSGALALAYWSVPRATLDIDVALDVEPPAIPRLLDALRAAGCEVPPDALGQAGRGDPGRASRRYTQRGVPAGARAVALRARAQGEWMNLEPGGWRCRGVDAVHQQ